MSSQPPNKRLNRAMPRAALVFRPVNRHLVLRQEVGSGAVLRDERTTRTAGSIEAPV